MHLMVLLGDEAQVETHLSLFGYSANLDVRQVHSLCRTYHRLENHFTHTHRMKLLGDLSHMESHFGLFGDAVSVGARWVHCLHQMYHRLRNRFGCTQRNYKVTCVM
jgi:hypothetical protein